MPKSSTKKIFVPQYSGNKSRAFWKLINLYDDKNMNLYKLGCDLQNLEDSILHLLEEAIQKNKQKVTRQKGKMKNNYVQCSTCGVRVSNFTTEEIVVRAYVECPECIMKIKKKNDERRQDNG